MASKKYDIAVKVGEYTDRNGEKKSRYENVGTVMQGTDGPFIVLKRTFNPAGVPNPDNKDSVLLSLFEPREREGNKPAPSSSAPASSPHTDDIPF